MIFFCSQCPCEVLLERCSFHSIDMPISLLLFLLRPHFLRLTFSSRSPLTFLPSVEKMMMYVSHTLIRPCNTGSMDDARSCERRSLCPSPLSNFSTAPGADQYLSIISKLNAGSWISHPHISWNA